MTISILFFSCTSTQKNNDVCGDVRTPANAEQCAILFPQKNLNTKNPIAEATDAEILKHMDALVIEHLKISTSNQHGIDHSLKQSLETVEKTLKQIFEKDPKYREIYKLKFSEKSKDYNKNSKSKDKEKRKEDEVKRKIIEDSLDPVSLAKQQMIFHQMKPGKFMMGEIGSQVKTTIDKPFSMMSTQFTQMMWARLQIAMGETDLNKISPSYNMAGPKSETIKIEQFDILMNPDHPVEQVSWDDVSAFIKKLNDLSNSNRSKIQNLLKKIIPGHQKGDAYDLPTKEQWVFVMRDRGNANNRFFDKPDESEIAKYAWYAENSENKTHAVAQLQPRMIDNGYGIRQPFYDLEGNVWEWTKDFDDRYSVAGNCGASFRDTVIFLDSGGHHNFGNSHDKSDDNLGFRLVRTNR